MKHSANRTSWSEPSLVESSTVEISLLFRGIHYMDFMKFNANVTFWHGVAGIIPCVFSSVRRNMGPDGAGTATRGGGKAI